MSVTAEKRNGKLTGKYVSRYRLNGKRYQVGTFRSKKHAIIAEKVHRLGMERLANLSLDNAPIDLIDDKEHTPWRPEEYRGVVTRLLDTSADKFYAWRKQRRIQKALEKDTFLRLNKMEVKRVVNIFEKD